jgi:hypothetical protein
MTVLKPTKAAARGTSVDPTPVELHLVEAGAQAPALFLIEPYLQLSKHYQVGTKSRLLERWYTALKGDDWKVFYRCQDEYIFRQAEVGRKKVELLAGQTHSRCQAELVDLSCGKSFEYRITRAGKEVFRHQASAPMAGGQPCRIGVFGDLADGGEGSKLMARRMHEQKPHLVVMPGDIVYDFGRTCEYLQKFFPVYNAPDTASGAPLLRSVVCAAAVGNHDVGTPKQTEAPSLADMPDLFAYFQFWAQPQNGPKLSRLRLKDGSRSARHLLKVLGRGFSKRSNYSFRFGSTYWLVLDANKYMDWTDKKLRRWLEEELKSSAAARWKFVSFHQPPFSSDVKYKHDQRMRVLCEVFEKHGVDAVFSGHCHYYECSRPLRYRVMDGSRPRCDAELTGKGNAAETTVPGLMALDMEFDGHEHCVPKGVLYIITGAAAKLPDEAHTPSPSHFTRRLRSDKQSLTILDVEDEQVIIRQVGPDGFDLDRFTIRKSPAAARAA